MEMMIRREEKEDRSAVENLIREAFWNVHVPGCEEHYLAHIMRDHPDFVPELDMVAEIDGKIVGSILYTVGKLTSKDGETKDCLTFGPIAVHPDYQRKGIGKALIETTCDLAVKMGYESIVIFGHPGNYVSRGFISSRKVNVCVGDGYFPTAMLVKPLVPNAFDGKRWCFSESPAFAYDAKDAEKFDAGFPRKEKKVLPSQEEFYIYSHSSIQE